MRKLLIGITVLALLWCGWWVLGAWAIERGLAQWRTDRIAEGWQMEGVTPEVSGFPFEWDAGFEGIAVVPPSEPSLSADNARVTAATYWPFGVQIVLPDTPMTLGTTTGDLFIRVQDGVVSANIRPTLSPQLRSFTARSNAWQLNSRLGNLLSADTLDLRINQDEDQRAVYNIALDSDSVTPGDVARQAIGLPASWPRSFDTFAAQMSVGLNPAAPPINAEGQRAVMQTLTIKNMAATWGPLNFEATGSLVLDDAGIPDGSLTAHIKNWRQAYEINER